MYFFFLHKLIRDFDEIGGDVILFSWFVLKFICDLTPTTIKCHTVAYYIIHAIAGYMQSNVPDKFE